MNLIGRERRTDRGDAGDRDDRLRGPRKLWLVIVGRFEFAGPSPVGFNEDEIRHSARCEVGDHRRLVADVPILAFRIGNDAEGP